MMTFLSRIALAAVASLLLSGCLLIPGQFDASLRLMSDGSYAFVYEGEMQLLSGDEKEMTPPDDKPFDPKKASCTTIVEGDGRSENIQYLYWLDEGSEEYGALTEAVDDDDGESSVIKRECTQEELAELREREKERQAAQQQDYERKSGMAAAMLGGAVPGNDEALRKFAKELSKYDGWEKVEYLGDNKFAVEYRVNGKFDRYFAFPVLPDATSQFPFFHIVPRADGRLELLSPALGGADGSNFMALMMLGAAGQKDAPDLSEIGGTFTLVTDGTVVANNAPDGFVEGADGVKTMRWDIGAGSAGPRALVHLKDAAR